MLGPERQFLQLNFYPRRALVALPDSELQLTAPLVLIYSSQRFAPGNMRTVSSSICSWAFVGAGPWVGEVEEGF